MATTTITEWHPHLGSIWQRLVGLWSDWVTAELGTWATAITAVSSCTCVQATVSNGTDTTVWNLVDGGRGTIDFQPPAYIASLPGWYATPPVLKEGTTPWHRPTLFNSQLVSLRGNLWVDYDNGDVVSYTLLTKFLSNLSMKAYTYFAVARYRNQIIPDIISIQTGVQTSSEYLYNSQPITPDVPVSRLAVIGGGGGSTVDLAPLVAAVEDLSFVDQTFTINNGADMFTVRGRIRVS